MKKLSKLKLKEFHQMDEREMKSIVGGYGGSGTINDPYRLGEITIYGSGPNKCQESWWYDLPVKCDNNMANVATTCRTADCSQIGQCRHLPFGAIKCVVGLNGGNGIIISGY